MTIRRALFWSALATALMATLSFAIGATTPPRSGPFASSGPILVYPYADAVRYVPRDFIWMWPALLMMLSYLILAACLRENAVGPGRLWGTVGLSFATASFAAVTIDYFIQLEVVQPALLAGEGAGVAAITQYNPHGLFIALETAGFLSMALSFAAFAPSLGKSRLEQVARWVLVSAAVLGVSAFIGMSAYYGASLGYRFEVTIIAIDWLVLAGTGALLAVAYRHPASA